MLILVSTPIGNLKDITLRALDSLATCDLILCEDTRHSLGLLKHYQISKPLLSYHKFNEQEKLDEVIDLLQIGKTICLISDAGTPLIADPGMLLVKKCYELKIPVTALPGPCALIQALVLSPFPYERFQFVGFLPQKEKEIVFFIQEASQYDGVTIAYEAPHRIEKTLELFHEHAPNTILAIARELTKKFEEVLVGTAQELRKHSLKGEIVLLFQGKKEAPTFLHLSLEEHVKKVEEDFHVTKKEAVKIVAELRNLNKKELYNEFFKK